MFRRFLNAADYWFGYSDDSSAGSYDPARECCVVIANDPAKRRRRGERRRRRGSSCSGDCIAPGRGAKRPSFLTTEGPDINTQLAQVRELEAKLAEEYCIVRVLRASIAGEASARGERARELGRQARDRINADFNIDNPDMPPRASQKLIAPATLLRATPPPLRHPKRRTCTARRRRSSSKWPSNRPRARRLASANRGARETMGARKAPNPRYTRVEQRSAPPTRGTRRPKSNSSTCAGKPETATPATSSTPDE
jgi:hypothetical protein